MYYVVFRNNEKGNKNIIFCKNKMKTLPLFSHIPIHNFFKFEFKVIKWPEIFIIIILDSIQIYMKFWISIQQVYDMTSAVTMKPWSILTPYMYILCN